MKLWEVCGKLLLCVFLQLTFFVLILNKGQQYQDKEVIDNLHWQVRQKPQKAKTAFLIIWGQLQGWVLISYLSQPRASDPSLRSQLRAATEQKQSQKQRKQNDGYQWESREDKLGSGINTYMHSIYKIDNQQGSIVQYRKLYSISYNLEGETNLKIIDTNV